jgi:hypothetical protein
MLAPCRETSAGISPALGPKNYSDVRLSDSCLTLISRIVDASMVALKGWSAHCSGNGALHSYQTAGWIHRLGH